MTIINTSSNHTLAAQLAPSQINQNDAVYVTESKKNQLNGTVLYQSGSFVVGRVDDRARQAQTLDQHSGATTHQNRLADDIGQNREILQKLGEQRLAHIMPQDLSDNLPPNAITSLVRNTLDGLERKDQLFANQLNGEGLRSFFERIDTFNVSTNLPEEFRPGYYAELMFATPEDVSDLDQGRKRNTEPPLSEVAGFVKQDANTEESSITYFDNRDQLERHPLRPGERGDPQAQATSRLVEDLKILKP